MSENPWRDFVMEFAQEAVRMGANRFDVLTLLMTEPDTYQHQMVRKRLQSAAEERRRRAEELGQPLVTSEKFQQLKAAIDRFVADMQPIVRAIETMNDPSQERYRSPFKPPLRYERPTIGRGRTI